MSEVVGEAVYKVRTDDSGTDFDGAGRRAGDQFGKGFGSTAKKVVAGFALGAGARELFQIGKEAFNEASDLNESLNAVNISYGKQRREVKLLGRDAADNLGLSRSAFNALAVRFSSFTNTISGGGRKQVQVLEDLTTRASDFASVMNLDVAESTNLFQSGLAGETEPLRKYGIDLSAAKVEAFALSEGIVKNKDDLDEAAKVQARYGLLMEQTAKTQGDFKNTSDEAANAQRILDANIDDVQARLGKAFLPVVKDVVGVLLDEGIPAAEKFSDWFVKDGAPAIRDFIDDARPVVEDTLPLITAGLKSVKRFGGFAVDAIGGIAGAFNDLPDWAQQIIIGGAGAVAVQKRFNFLGLGGAPGSGILAKGGTPASPAYVYVTNPGFGSGAPVTPGTGSDGGRRPGRRPPGAIRRNAPGVAALALFGAPTLTDLFLGEGTWEEATTREDDARERFFEKWKGSIQDQAQKAREFLADELNTDVAKNIGEGGFFGGIPFTDIFVTEGSKEDFSNALSELTGPELVALNEDIKQQFGVSIPNLVRQGMIEEADVVKFYLEKNREQFSLNKRQAERYANFLKTAFPPEIESVFKLLGIDTAKGQINGLFTMFNTALSGHPGPGAGGQDRTAPPPPPDGGHPGPRSERTLVPTTVIQTANFHDWNDFEAKEYQRKRRAGIGGRRQ